MFLEAGFGLIAICLPTMASVLHMDILSKVVSGLSSLFFLFQRSRKTEEPGVDGHERIYTQPSLSPGARSMQSIELQNTKVIKGTDSIEQIRSMV